MNQDVGSINVPDDFGSDHFHGFSLPYQSPLVHQRHGLAKRRRGRQVMQDRYQRHGGISIQRLQQAKNADLMEKLQLNVAHCSLEPVS